VARRALLPAPQIGLVLRRPNGRTLLRRWQPSPALQHQAFHVDGTIERSLRRS
jgi:hypothetical protein